MMDVYMSVFQEAGFIVPSFERKFSYTYTHIYIKTYTYIDTAYIHIKTNKQV